MNGHEGWGWFGGGFMWLFWIPGVIVVLALLKLFTVKVSASSGYQEGSALDILKKRYASGEINEAEYQKRKKQLQ